MGSTAQLSLCDGSGPLAEPGQVGLTELELIDIAVVLGARHVTGWSEAEQRLSRSARRVARSTAGDIKERIVAGEDVLGDSFCALRSPAERRPQGATYTPIAIVEAMIAWAAQAGEPARIVDPGTGSARYLIKAGIKFPHAQLIGVETDPLAALMARANLAACGMAERAQVIVEDYRRIEMPSIAGRTLYIGNPPYVRHHLLGPAWKGWLAQSAAQRGLPVSQLAGLHVHFFLATIEKARPGDFGSFVTASEWLDVNYGKLVRKLFLGDLGGQELTLVEPTAKPFPDAATTAVICNFKVGDRPQKVRLRRVGSIEGLKDGSGGRDITREALAAAARWTPVIRGLRRPPAGYIELGELCRVHRGQVTGLNRVWIVCDNEIDLPESVLFPAVTKARELFAAGAVLKDTSGLRSVIDIPPVLDGFDRAERGQIERFLKHARACGAHEGYVARARRAWWSVGLRDPAPILCTYMARRPPAFVRNRAQARHINIAHGIYPRQTLSEWVLTNLIAHLAGSVSLREGRAYAGGLTKFEPREVERLLVPDIKQLEAETCRG